MIKRILTILLIQFCVILSFAQEDEEEIVILSPKQNYDNGNYVLALEQYLELYKSDSTNHKTNEKLGSCYLKLNIDKSKAVLYFEKLIKSGSKISGPTLFEIGLAYHLNNKFDEALKYYSLYKGKTKDSESLKIVNRKIEMVNNAKELTKFPLNVTFENLGKKINSKSADFNPFVNAKESYIAFATRRYGVTGSLIDFDGYYTTDIFLSRYKNSSFYKPRSIGGNINSELVEVPTGISVDGKRIFFNADNYNAQGDIWYTDLASRGRSFMTAKGPKGGINLPDTYESGATMNSERTIIIFGTEREDGYGGTDLYISRKLPTGEWGLPVNLGDKINTPYDDLNPQLSFDETTLYFASEGHTSIGGYDIFKSEWNSTTNTATKVQNIGYPINTTDDNMTYCPTATSKYGYISALRPEGFGDLDIYRVVYGEEDALFSVVKGKLFDADTTNLAPVTAFITATNMETDEIAGNYDIPSTKNGKYVMALPPGKYTIMIEGEGYKMKVEKVFILDKAGYRPIINKDIYLERTGPKPTQPKKAVTQVEVVTQEEDNATVNGAEQKSFPKDRVIYKVQIGKTNGVVTSSYAHKLKQLGIVKEVLKNNTVVYTKGNFMNSIDAIKLQKSLKAKGFKIAFPIAVLNGEKIPLQKGIEYQKSQAQNR